MFNEFTNQYIFYEDLFAGVVGLILHYMAHDKLGPLAAAYLLFFIKLELMNKYLIKLKKQMSKLLMNQFSFWKIILGNLIANLKWKTIYLL